MPGAVCIQLSPNCSLTSKTARWFLVSVSLGPVLAGVFFSLLGFWLVLPFAGLEIAAVAVAVYCSMRRQHDCEIIVITEDEITLEARRRKIQVKTVFSRHWTRVKLRSPLSSLHPSRLCLESRGRACELGRFLTETERCALAAQLQRLVGNMNESPAL
jgi:uncharacterized membrane protein